MKRRFAAVLPVVMLIGAPALAGGMAEPTEAPIIIAQAPPPAPISDWTGFYAGAQLGYGDVGTDGAVVVGGDGGLGGVHAGYRQDFGQFVLGGELDYDRAELELDAGAGTIDNVTRLKLSAGYDLGSALLYGTVGGASADANIGGVAHSDQGYLVGAGLAYDLGNDFVVGGEVLYHAFDDFDATGVDVDVTTISARVSYRF